MIKFKTNRKGISLIPFIFIVLAISITLISWSLYNVYFGSKYQFFVFESSQIDTLRNEIEQFKGFLRTSLIYAVQKTLYQSAIKGGLISRGGNQAWICNSPNPPNFNRVKNCIERFSKYRLNLHVGRYKIDLPIAMDKRDFSSVRLDITENEVLSGIYDEGNFQAKAKGSGVNLTSKNLSITDQINLKENIPMNRFWYLYRNIKAWALNNKYGRDICGCTASCLGCNCVEDVANEALTDLNNRFDQYVECNVIESCECQRKTGQNCTQGNACVWWNQSDLPINKRCMGNCYATCGNPSSILASFYPSKPTSSKPNPTQIQMKPSPLTSPPSPGCYEIVTQENEITAIHTYTCKDEKYYIPTDEGPKPLVFSVTTFVSLKHPEGCKEYYNCPGILTACENRTGKVCGFNCTKIS